MVQNDEVLRLRLVDDPASSEAGFDAWLAMLGSEADAHDWGWLLPGSRLSFRHIENEPRVRTEFSAGARASSAIVQINEPTTAGSENPLSGMAIDEQGRRYVVRQGTLHENRVSPRIGAEAFERLTRLRPVEMTVAASPSKRRWFVVARIDGEDAAFVVRQTADFVDRCWAARLTFLDEVPDGERLEDLFGHGESGGTTLVSSDPRPREVRRMQGYVWEQLHDLLQNSGIVLRKPRHADGYEVDAEILAPAGPMLLEIKTTTLPADIYAGCGQLSLYPALIPRLRNHRRVLLVPGECRPAFADAVRSIGVDLYAYDLRLDGDRPEASFQETFLRACGVARTN